MPLGPRLREIAASCLVFISLNLTMLTNKPYSSTDSSLKRDILIGQISQIIGKRSTETSVVSNGILNSRKSIREITEPWGTPRLMECGLKSLKCTHRLWQQWICQRKLLIHVMIEEWRYGQRPLKYWVRSPCSPGRGQDHLQPSAFPGGG